MDKKSVEETLKLTIDENKQEDDWVNLAILGGKLKQNGIDYKSLGFEKLMHFIKSHSDVIEYRTDNSNKLPVYYVKNRPKKLVSEKNKIMKSSPKSALTDWAYLGHYQSMLNRLEDLALDERWYYKDENPNFPFPILASYLHYTFYRLLQEKGKVLIEDNFAAFNTGLVDSRYEPIYALFVKTNKFSQGWKLIDFCIAGEGKVGKDLVRTLKNRPERAHYFDNVSDMLYDTRVSKPEIDYRHIILDNVDRLPISFILENKPDDFQIKNPKILSVDERSRYFEDLAQSIESDKKAYRNFTNRFKDALELSLKRVAWNFKTAIPMYYPTQNKMSLLLPLALVDDEIVDIALVVEKTKSGNHLGHTILPLEWAYSNARLVARPDSDWLVASEIESISSLNEIDDEE